MLKELKAFSVLQHGSDLTHAEELRPLLVQQAIGEQEAT